MSGLVFVSRSFENVPSGRYPLRKSENDRRILFCDREQTLFIREVCHQGASFFYKIGKSCSKYLQDFIFSAFIAWENTV